MPTRALLVFSHLRWNFVYQRPQHLLSRLARHFRVIYVEEPLHHDGAPALEVVEADRGVTVLRPHLSKRAVGFHDDHIADLQLLLREHLEAIGVEDYAVWFYTPMALPLIDPLQPRAVVYDCMDELSAFLNAPRQLVQRESALLKRADLVFTGGPSLYRSKKSRHPSVHCFPSSVDAQHFASARTDAPTSNERPTLGFFGVLDERVDRELIGALADARPDWDFIMVGPVVKIPVESLPQRPNIRYLGQRSYEELPGLVAQWDVCLLPFALNEATRYISPTKTLEYMAAGKPIVSTPINDVVECFGSIVHVASTPAAFIRACEASLKETPRQAHKRREVADAAVDKTSWDATAAAMRELIDRAWSSGAHPTAVPVETTRAAGSGIAGSRPREVETIVIGAGPTGLSAAYHLGRGSLLLEAGSTVGGWCRSIVDNGFTFDHAGHIMFSNDPYVHEMYELLLGDNVHWQDREAWIFSHDVYTRYPFQQALYGLPPDVLKECIVGAIEARFGPLKEHPPAAPARAAAATTHRPLNGCEPKAESITDCCGDGIAESTAPLVQFEKSIRHTRTEPANFEEFIYRVWGAGVARHFAIPYNRKLWAVPLNEMETSWLGGRVPLPDLEEMIEGALRPSQKPIGPNARFGYPLRGGFQALMDGFLPLLEGELLLDARVVAVDALRHQVTLADGRRFQYEQLISTMPLPQLVKKLSGEALVHVRESAARLRHTSVRCVNLGVARTDVTDKHWIYYPGDSLFHRIFVQGNASPHCNPPGGFGLTCEITYAPTKPLPCDGDELIDLCIRDCIRVGMLREDDRIIARNQVDMPYAYVVYDHARAHNFKVIDEWCARHGIILAGRYSEWQYYNSDHAFLAGRKAAEKARAPDEETTTSTVARSLTQEAAT
ncbi:MAG TPA: FAD-dependent oxidoreductase [Steroidobacteraceae bacterium]|nr:FAD-dependent oxidoreductase [Steroidobacteraceae bacterium]